jgi:hypothetical protein
MLTSESFSELGQFLKIIMDDEGRSNFLKEVIDMCENEFFVHQWLTEEESRGIVEGRMEANAEKRAQKLAEELAVEKAKVLAEELADEKLEKNITKTIKSMLENNLEYDMISKITGKSIDEIKEIEQSLKEE